MLQDWYRTLCPSQYFPPFCGTGSVHSLWENSTPPPHVLEHCSHGPHKLQPPSTATCDTTQRGERREKSSQSRWLELSAKGNLSCVALTTVWASGFEAAQCAGVPRLQAKSVLKFGTRMLSASACIPATCVTHH